jgi:GT2 family glycosyltransferase
MTINFSIIIPNFNGAKYLTDCLKNLNIAIHKCPNTKFEIIVVDNGSTDNSLELVSKYKIIKNKINLGFAVAVNQGIKVAQYNYVCLLNNDLNLDRNYFILMTQNIKKYPKVACFCGSVFNRDGTEIESRGISFDWSGKCFQNKKHPEGFVWGSSGAVVIYNKKILEKIGLFDEHYFAYIEDVDVAFRLQRNNYQTFLIPKAFAFHLGGGTSNRMGNFRAKQIFKNWIYFIHKNYTFTEFIKNLPQIVVERLRNLSYLLKSTINK